MSVTFICLPVTTEHVQCYSLLDRRRRQQLASLVSDERVTNADVLLSLARSLACRNYRSIQ